MRRIAKRIKFDGRLKLDLEKAVAASERIESRRTTSILLEEAVVRELQHLAKNREVSYQKLVRALILDGLQRFEKVN